VFALELLGELRVLGDVDRRGLRVVLRKRLVVHPHSRDTRALADEVGVELLDLEVERRSDLLLERDSDDDEPLAFSAAELAAGFEGAGESPAPPDDEERVARSAAERLR